MIGPDVAAGRRRVAVGCMRVTVVLAVLVACGASCRKSDDDPEVVTSTSAAALEEGRRLLAAGDFAAARDAFAAAADGGGLQPDFYCEARLQQAHCAARIGDHDAADALLDDLAAGAPDLDRIENMRAFIKARRASATSVKPPAADQAEAPAAP